MMKRQRLNYTAAAAAVNLSITAISRTQVRARFERGQVDIVAAEAQTHLCNMRLMQSPVVASQEHKSGVSTYLRRSSLSDSNCVSAPNGAACHRKAELRKLLQQQKVTEMEGGWLMTS